MQHSRSSQSGIFCECTRNLIPRCEGVQFFDFPWSNHLQTWCEQAPSLHPWYRPCIIFSFSVFAFSKGKNKRSWRRKWKLSESCSRNSSSVLRSAFRQAPWHRHSPSPDISPRDVHKHSASSTVGLDVVETASKGRWGLYSSHLRILPEAFRKKE